MLKVAKNKTSGEGGLDNFLEHEYFLTFRLRMLKHGLLRGLQ